MRSTKQTHLRMLAHERDCIYRHKSTHNHIKITPVALRVVSIFRILFNGCGTVNTNWGVLWPWFLVAFLGALISKGATMDTTVQEHVGHLTHHDPFGCGQKQFYMCDESYWLVGASSGCAWCRLAEIPTSFNTQIISALVHRQGGDSCLHTKHVITHNVM